MLENVCCQTEINKMFHKSVNKWAIHMNTLKQNHRPGSDVTAHFYIISDVLFRFLLFP